MAITFDQGASTYSTGSITISVTTGNLIAGVGISGGSQLTTSHIISGGGTWTQLAVGGASDRWWRMGYCLATTGSGNTQFDQTGEAGDYAWHIAEFNWSSGSYVDTQGQVLTSTSVFDSGAGISCQSGDALYGGWGDYLGGGFSSWNNGFQTSSSESSHYSMTAYLIATGAATIDLSGTIGSTVTARSAFVAVFREGGEASSTPTLKRRLNILLRLCLSTFNLIWRCFK